MHSSPSLGPFCALAVVIALATGPRCPAQQAAGEQPVRTFSGRVLDERGRPLAGAAVAILPTEQTVDTARLLAAPQTTSAADGTWRLTASAADFLTVVAVAAGRTLDTTSVRYDQRADASLPDLLLLPGATLDGRILDAAGQPIEGACVVAMARMPFAIGRTDAGGRFTIPGLPATGVRTAVQAPGHFTERCFAQPGTPLEVTLQASGFVRGRVVDDHGAAIADVAVQIRGLGEHDDWYFDQPRTRADGSFTVGIPCRGPFRVHGTTTTTTAQPYLTSELLRGPADDVVIRDWPYPAPDGVPLSVECTDAATGAPIPLFHATWSYMLLEHAPGVVYALLAAPRALRAAFSFTPQLQFGGFGTVAVDAPGFARTLVAVPTPPTSPLRVALGPESTLSGRVLDAMTDAPIGDAAVVALPVGVRGRPPAPLAGAARTDAEGRYRIGSLPAGDVVVQVFAEARPASPARVVSIGAAANATLDLVVPKPRRLVATLTGALPDGPPGQLTVTPTYGDTVGCTNPRLGWPGTVAVTGAHAVSFSPVDDGPYGVELWLPSRVQAGAGRRFALGTLTPDTGDQQLALPPLDHVIVRGRVRLPADVSAARLVVQASTDDAKSAPRASRRSVRETLDTSRLAADGSFAFDLPTGAWWFQLVDAETGIVFHSDQAPRTIAAGGEPLVIEPTLHWLELELAPAKDGDEIVFDSLRLTVPRPRDRQGKVLDFARRDRDFPSSGDPAREEHVVSPGFGATRHRWLVPKGQVAIVAYQTEWDARNGTRGHIAGMARVDITAPAHTVRMTIAALPFAASKLLAPQR